MKKILITGKNSYVGRSLKEWLDNFPDKYAIDTINLRSDAWKQENFLEYDVVVHTVGIAHIKEKKENKHLYYKVNRDLAYEVAKKAKVDGVKHFIFLSSMSVYGIESGIIDQDSPLKPKTNYGKSKLEAEKLITTLESDTFRVAILRPPMIYGKGCKGNYRKLSKLARKMPFFPKINNQRSMIFIDNLSGIIKWIIDNNLFGLFYPQNNKYVNTSKLVELIANTHGKKIIVTKAFNPLFIIFKKNKTLKKVFGNLVYDRSLSETVKLNQISLEESIKLTEF